MQQLADALRALPTDVALLSSEPKFLREVSDAELIAAVALAVARPKCSRASSFTLHAPLELMARAALLASTPPSARLGVRLRIAAIAAEYAQGEEIDPPDAAFPDTGSAVEVLVAALTDADADLADAAISFLIPRLSAHALSVALADAVVPCLGAAAHAPILLADLPAMAGGAIYPRVLLRAPVRALAAEGRLRLRWFDAAPASAQGPADLFKALADPPRRRSTSPFIAPTMLAVEADGLAARTLARPTANISPQQAGRELGRIAALSMLQDDPAHAPYGWTHALTMARGAIGLSPYAREPLRCIRAAATYVLGFRATLGRVGLLPDWKDGPTPSAAALAAFAGAHPDAHLAKYTLACMTAAREDPEAASLYVSAAAWLADWWRANPGAAFAA